MMILKVLAALFIVLGGTFGLPAPESKELHVMDSNVGADITELDEGELHKVERRAVSQSKVSLLVMN